MLMNFFIFLIDIFIFLEIKLKIIDVNGGVNQNLP